MELSSPPSGIIAPFVMKTYQMVNDPSTDSLVTWGSANNSILIVEPIDFSNLILPAYFKHNNFPSFVRQLNIYGFRKVDPDRWELANQWFLRGQKHLLHNIGCRKTSRNAQCKGELGMDDEELLAEIARLRDEQSALDKELRGMNRRLEATEWQPGQMMAFLCEVAENPEMIPRMMLEKDLRKARNQTLYGEKKRRLMADSDPASSLSLSSMAVLESIESEDEDNGAVSSPKVGFDIDNLQPLPAHLESYRAVGHPIPQLSSGDQLICLAEMGTKKPRLPSPREPPPYPFSLFGGGF